MVFYFYSQLLQDPEELYQRRGKNFFQNEYCTITVVGQIA